MPPIPYWLDTVSPSPTPPLDRDLQVDVLIIGGGITGVTAAYLLGRSGRSVALLERDSLASADTGHTTAHLTYMTDTPLTELVESFGEEKARLAWQGGAEAMAFIRQTVEAHGMDCDLAEVPGYLSAADTGRLADERAWLDQEAEWARKLGFDVALQPHVPPRGLPGIVFPSQFQFHPVKYVLALAAQARAAGVQIHERTEVTEFDGERSQVKAGGFSVGYQHVVIATHVPLQGNAGTAGAALFQTKLASYSTYAVGGKTSSSALDAYIWSDLADPFRYLRVERHPDGCYAILGGEDHKTGQTEDHRAHFERLGQTLSDWIPGTVVTHRWSGQVVETVDGLPYIGETVPNQFIATGFSGNGITFGTLAALMARAWVDGEPTPWSALLDPGRKTVSAFGEYVRENLDFPVKMIADRWRIPKDESASLPAGSGTVVRHRGEAVAVYRSEDGGLHRYRAVCPHMGCIVAWNDAEKTWDCPCHGSRFTATGAVVAGPAEQPLQPLSASEAGKTGTHHPR